MLANVSYLNLLLILGECGQIREQMTSIADNAEDMVLVALIVFSDDLLIGI